MCASVCASTASVRRANEQAPRKLLELSCHLPLQRQYQGRVIVKRIVQNRSSRNHSYMSEATYALQVLVDTLHGQVAHHQLGLAVPSMYDKRLPTRYSRVPAASFAKMSPSNTCTDSSGSCAKSASSTCSQSQEAGTSNEYTPSAISQWLSLSSQPRLVHHRPEGAA